MDKIYQILKLIKEEFVAFEVNISLSQIFEDMEDEVGEEVFGIIIMSELCKDPFEIKINTDPKLLKDFDVEKCLQHLKFELSSIEEFGSEDFYYNNSTRVH